jgi:hypothetical protein
MRKTVLLPAAFFLVATTMMLPLATQPSNQVQMTSLTERLRQRHHAAYLW